MRFLNDPGTPLRILGGKHPEGALSKCTTDRNSFPVASPQRSPTSGIHTGTVMLPEFYRLLCFAKEKKKKTNRLRNENARRGESSRCEIFNVAVITVES